MSRLDEALKAFKIGEANELLKNPQGQITENTLNIALLSGHHPFVSELLNLGAKPNEDTITCALFSGQPHYIVAKLLEAGADVTKAIEHVEHSSMHHPIRSLIKGGRISNLSVKASDALQYAESRLSDLRRKYGPFNGQQDEVNKQELMERQEEDMKNMKSGRDQHDQDYSGPGKSFK